MSLQCTGIYGFVADIHLALGQCIVLLLCVRQVLLLTEREGFFSSCYTCLTAAVGAFKKLCLYTMRIVTFFISLLYLCFSFILCY